MVEVFRASELSLPHSEFISSLAEKGVESSGVEGCAVLAGRRTGRLGNSGIGGGRTG